MFIRNLRRLLINKHQHFLNRKSTTDFPNHVKDNRYFQPLVFHCRHLVISTSCLPCIKIKPKHRPLSTFKMPESKPFERLPLTVTPVNYNIRLKPNLKSFTFEGSEDIDVEV